MKTISYTSSRHGGPVEFKQERLDDVRAHLVRELGLSETRTVLQCTHGEVMDALLSYRKPDGERLLLNHLAPLFLYVCLFGDLW